MGAYRPYLRRLVGVRTLIAMLLAVLTGLVAPKCLEALPADAWTLASSARAALHENGSGTRGCHPGPACVPVILIALAATAIDPSAVATVGAPAAGVAAASRAPSIDRPPLRSLA